MAKSANKQLTANQTTELLNVLKTRFDQNTGRHTGIEWQDVETKLRKSPEKIWSLNQMEATGGEPDVVASDKGSNEYFFFDCCAESPKERRSYCYDGEALKARAANKPKNNCVDVAAAMGIELLTEEQYRQLQQSGNFDTKTSSWIKTPPAVRALGGALFCDRRYNRVFVYHNGAESYYAGRGFRGCISV